MEYTVGTIKEISVLGKACFIAAGPLQGEPGKVTGEIFSEFIDKAGRQYHTGVVVQTKFARLTLSPKDIALQAT